MNLPAQPFFATAPQRVALARQRFFDDGQRPSGLVGDAVIQSWNRCLSARRAPREAVAFDPVSPARARTAQARSRTLLQAAAQELLQLETTLARTPCRLLLTDSRGIVVHAGPGGGSPGDRVLPVAARVGVALSEGAIGTAAPGLVLHSGRACTVLGGEHYFDAVQGMHCAAAPVLDRAGRLVAVLDLSIENRPFGFDAASLVALHAAAIENRLLVAQSADLLVLQFQASAALLGTPMEALAAVDGEGRLAWLNGAARRLLPGTGPGDDAGSLFGLTLPALLAWVRHLEPTRCHLPGRLSVWLRAHLRTHPVATEPVPVAPAAGPPAEAEDPHRATLAEHDRTLIERTLAQCDGNVARAARRLGVSRGLLYRRLKGTRRG